MKFKALANMPLLLPSRGHGLRSLVDDYAREAGIQLDVVVKVDGYGSLKDLVRAGFGYTVMPATAFRQEQSVGQLCLAPLCDPSSVRHLTLCYPQDRRISRAARFAGDILVEKMIGLVRDGIWNGAFIGSSDAS
jgi:DNA-binding transcriptional LysR family regulator